MGNKEYDPLQNLKDVCLRASMRVEDIQKHGYARRIKRTGKTTNKRMLEKNIARILFDVKLLINNSELDESFILKQAAKLDHEHQQED